MTAPARNGSRAPRSITAAAKRVPVRGEPGSTPAIKRTDDGWQNEAWSYFDDVPEVKFAARFLGNALSRLRMFPAMIVDPEAPPMALADAVGESGMTDAIASAANEEFARLGAGVEGMGGLQREFGINLTIAGEANLVGRDVDGLEEWRVYSESALVKVDDVLAIKESPGGQPTKLGDDDFVARVWRRHARWPGLADSNMRSILDVCEELLIYGRQFRAVGRSRNNAGVLLIPNELDFDADPVVVDDEVPVENELTPMEKALIDSLIEPTADDGSASTVVPHILRGAYQYLDRVRHLPLDRKIDEQAVSRIVHLISRMANGLDIPVEVLTGVADANHWTAWQIEDATYKAHVEPLAQVPAQAYATTFLRPALIARMFDPAIVNQIVVGIDPSDLVVRPNRGADAKDAHDRKALSDEALRQYLGFSDADAPEDEELLRRYTMEHGVGGEPLVRDLLVAVGYTQVPDAAEAAETAAENAPPPAPGQPPGSPPEEGGPPTPDEPDEPAAAARALLAAAGQQPLGERLSLIDSRLRERIQLAASEALNSALDRAGSRLRARAQGEPELRQRVNGRIANDQVGIVLGDDGRALAAAEELIGEQDFAALSEAYLAWVAQAREEALAVIRRVPAAVTAAVTGPDPFDLAAAEELGNTALDDTLGWVHLLEALVHMGRGRIFTPDGTPDDGEFDPFVSVPAGPVRESLILAGGGSEMAAEPGPLGKGAAAGGPASGRKMIRFVHARTGAIEQGWRWETGSPRMPFPPHHSIATDTGGVFTSWDDPRLSSGGGFPSRGHYFPGDHKGCQCDAVPVLIYPDGRVVTHGAPDEIVQPLGGAYPGGLSSQGAQDWLTAKWGPRAHNPARDFFLSKVDKASANEMAAEIDRLFTKYPDIAARIRVLGGPDVADLMSFGRLGPKVQGASKKGVLVLNISGTRRRNNVLRALEKETTETHGNPGTWHPSGANTVASIVSHEFAHHMTYKVLDDVGGPRAKAAIDAIIARHIGTVADYASTKVMPDGTLVRTAEEAFIHSRNVLIETQVSRYALTNLDELISESFSMVETGNPTPFAREITETLLGLAAE